MGIKRIGMLTGGGDCPGLNCAIRGAVYKAISEGIECVGLTEGWKGLLECSTMPLKLEDVECIMNRGGTILGTSRTNPYKKEKGPEKCLESFKELKLDALIAMGGEDTLGVATRLYEENNFPVIGVPKTMDNDLSATDYTFGFDTSTTHAIDAAESLLDTGRSHRRIMVLEVMGRHAGWVALYTGLASGADWIMLPEENCDMQKMCTQLKIAHARKKTALVIVSEGATIPCDNPEKEQCDEFGHKILKSKCVGEEVAKIIEKNTGIETRVAVIGHIQRGGPPTLFDRMLGLRVGHKATELAIEGKFGYMVALRGTDVIPVKLREATGKLRTVDESWIKFMHDFFK